MNEKLIRNNHYVPIWYQKNFLSSKKAAFHYLNLYPDKIELPDGKVKSKKQICWPFSPKQCFYQTDLYTTSFLGYLNDEIERYLFGKIDSDGSIAIKALIDMNYRLFHDYFLKVFEYMDIQKLRTPKGLIWLSQKFSMITHNQLLLEMQNIQRLHYTLWAEAVKEIVLANNSKIKFIVSDHPVTVYNAACPPDSTECKYPNDPRIEMQGTQTIFPLDSNRCLILTNLDYAKNPNLQNLKEFRPNPNPFRDTLIRYDNIINERELSEEDVTHINWIIKSRASQFLAAEEKEWLFPEKRVLSDWAECGKVLMPPSDKLYKFGGEIYVGYKDGSSAYFDQYGRREPESKFLRKKKRVGKIGPNAQCPCGSGKKYKKCCRDKPDDERPASDVLSIRERNLYFFDIIIGILGVDRSRNLDWDELRRNLTNEKIAEIYKAVAGLWPPSTDLFALLPRPDSNVLRALFTGIIDPRVTYMNIACFSFYADEILIQSPFANPNNMRKEFSPIENPGQYRNDTIKNLFFLFLIIPWIENGLINLYPDPWNFNYALMKTVMKAAEKRKDAITFDKKSFKQMKELFFEDYKRTIFTMPDENLRAFIRYTSQDLSEEEISKLIDYTKRMNAQYPFVDLNPGKPGKESSQMQISHIAPNMEMTMFLAQATGSMIITDNNFRWSEICSSIPYYYGLSKNPWAKFETFASDYPVQFPLIVEQLSHMQELKKSEFMSVKRVLKRLWNSINADQSPNNAQIDHLQEEFDIAQAVMSKSIEKLVQKGENVTDTSPYPRPMNMDAKLSCKISPIGHINNLVYRLLVSYAGHDKYLKSLPLSLYVEYGNKERA
jgi:SEC-C motif.